MNSSLFDCIVEGNVGAGKSYFLEKLDDSLTLDQRSSLFFVPEPIEKYCNYRGKHNPLQLLYDCPRKYFFSTQLYFLDIIEQKQLQGLTWARTKTQNSIFERSLLTCKVFVEANYELGCLNGFEYDYLTDKIDEKQKAIIKQQDRLPTKYIYIKSSVSDCLERIKARNRPEESDACKMHELICELSRQHDVYIDELKEDETSVVFTFENNGNLNIEQQVLASKEFIFDYGKN